MARTTKLKPVKGARVRLLHDITTRGGRKFRAGVVMRVTWTHGGIGLTVRVRARWHFLTLRKKESYLFEIVSVPDPEK